MPRRRRSALAVVVTVVLVSCSDAPDAAPTRRTLAASTTTTVGFDPNGPVATTTSGPPVANACDRRLLPISRDFNAFPSPAPLVGEVLDYPDVPAMTDGDGNTVRTDPHGHIEIVRPDGVVAIRRGSGGVHFPSGVTDIGDLDGDGRTDYVFEVDLNGTYYVSGTVSPGTHEVRDVGVRVPLLTNARGPGLFHAVGDQNGDGADDLAIDDNLYSGRAIFSHRPGSTIQLESFRNVARYMGALRLVPSGEPAIVQMLGEVGTTAFDGVEPVELRLLGSTTDCLVTSNPTFDGPGNPYYASFTDVHAWLVDGQRIVELKYVNRNAHLVIRWNLDA